jgi:hypothetical protein
LKARRVSIGLGGGTGLVRGGLEHHLTKTSRLLAAFAASIAVVACSPDSDSPSPGPATAEVDQAEPPARQSSSAANGQNETAPAAPKPVAASGRRCGWLHNPTPANWWLVDADGEWVLGSQGSEPVAGMDDMPDMSASGWVETNGHYGYGCACMDMVVDPTSGDVLKVSNAAPKPLAQCRADPKLPDPDAG